MAMHGLPKSKVGEEHDYLFLAKTSVGFQFNKYYLYVQD